MKSSMKSLSLFVLVGLNATSLRAANSLPGWNDGPNKSTIIEFVEKVTKAGNPDFVPEQDRIAVFDNDGTLWCEKPLYTQLRFALDRVKTLAPDRPEWKTQEPFKSLLTTSREKEVSVTEAQLLEILIATHAGMSTDKFADIVSAWIATAKHPRFDRLYTELVYQPMLELIAYLEANGFHVFIVSGGGVEFMRPWTERVYGIPPEQVIGSGIEVKYEVRDGKPILLREPRIDFIDDKEGKPIGIHKFIGRKPILAFGNSDGDFQMLEWTTTDQASARLGLILHHDDAKREYAYDRDSQIGHLDKALDEAPSRGWKVVSMKDDFKVIFPKE
jgi:phosphoglycolate phosphatase-like HAD superfamily hydrolase